MSRKGFTLIELLVVVAIVGVLAAILAPQVSTAIEKSKIARAAADFRVIENAGNRIFMDLGVYPAEGNWCDGGSGGGGNGDGRAFTHSAGLSSQYLDLWNGPYLKSWPKQHPFGACVTYLDGRYGSYFDRNGIPNDDVYVHYRDANAFSDSIKQKIDKILDDGDTSTGAVKNARSGLCYFIGEGSLM